MQINQKSKKKMLQAKKIILKTKQSTTDYIRILSIGLELACKWG